MLRLFSQHCDHGRKHVTSSEMEDRAMNGIIYLVGLIVVVMAILSLFGLR
jgi:hypothetical protein